MPEWVRIVVSALSGVAVGGLMEPLRFWITNSLKKRELRRGLYENIASITCLAEFMQAHSEESNESEAFLATINADVFTHYYTSDRATFYRMHEAPAIKRFYDAVARWLELAERLDTPRKIKALDIIMRAKEQEVNGKYLDAVLLCNNIVKFSEYHWKRTEAMKIAADIKLAELQEKLRITEQQLGQLNHEIRRQSERE